MNPAPNATVTQERSSDDGGSYDGKKTSPSSLRLVKNALSEEVLARLGSRAATYDRENRFFEEDFEELRAAKYLLLPLPPEFGGAGMTLAEVCREQRRLAYHAPATALAVNMYLYWIGVAADLWRLGDVSLEWLLREAAAGEIFYAIDSRAAANPRRRFLRHRKNTLLRNLNLSALPASIARHKKTEARQR